jgi:hypothetical protein
MPSEAIGESVRRTLIRYSRLRSLSIPTPVELNYTRVLTHWQNQSAFLDPVSGAPRALRIDKSSSSFNALVYQAIPGANSLDVRSLLTRHRLISDTADGRVRLLATEFVARGAQLAIGLRIIGDAIRTCADNLCSPKLARRLGQIQRAAQEEHFDLKYLKQYDAFQRASANAFMQLHGAWLIRHQVKGLAKRKGRTARVGITVSGFLKR